MGTSIKVKPEQSVDPILGGDAYVLMVGAATDVAQVEQITKLLPVLCRRKEDEYVYALLCKQRPDA